MFGRRNLFSQGTFAYWTHLTELSTAFCDLRWTRKLSRETMTGQ